MFTAILTTVVTWCILLGFYHLVLARQTFFQWNRAYLLGSIAFGLLLPWINLPVQATHFAPALSANVQAGIQQLQTQMEVVVEGSSSASASSGWQLMLWILMAGMLIRLARLGYGLWRIASYRSAGTIERHDTFRLVRTHRNHLPFSFFKNIYWGNLIDLETVDQEVVLRHEQVHLKQGHSWDIVAMEILLIPFWWCLPLYVYKKDIRVLHEYLADAATLKNISVKNYKHILLKYIMPGAHPSMAHAFTNFQLKSRLIMMTKTPSAANKKLLYLSALPLMILFMSFKPVTTSFWPASIEQHIIGDPISEAQIEAALNPALTKLKANPADEQAMSMLVNQIKILQAKHPADKTLLLNTGQRLLKECETGIYLAKVDGVIMVMHDKAQIEGIYDEVDDMPHFPGCDDMEGDELKDCRSMKLVMSIYNNIKYPKEARDMGAEGMVLVRFIVNTMGQVESPEIIRSVAGGCDEEVVRVVKTMEFVPGVKDGKNVNVIFTLPVKFKLEGEAKDKDKDKDKMKEKGEKSKDKEKYLKKQK